MQRLELAECIDQSSKFFDADEPCDFLLRTRPVRLGGLQRRCALGGDRDFAHTRIAATDDLDVSSLDQRIEGARQGRPTSRSAKAQGV